MSSTNRGAKRPEHDYYATDPDVIEKFLRAWLEDEPGLSFSYVLDPCAGGNALPIEWEYKKDTVITIPPMGMPYPRALRRVFNPSLDIITNDIRQDSLASLHEDFLALNDLPTTMDLVITNPPFSLAMEVIEKSLSVTCPGGYVVMLLRLNFLGSEKRFPLFRDNPPERIYVHSKRMSFTPDGRTDSGEYAHMVWRRGPAVRETKLRVI